MKKGIALVLSIVMIFAVLPFSSAAADYSSMNTVRVGLVYGSNAEAGIAALSEFGYKLGYFTASGEFVQLAALPNRYIAVCKDALVYQKGNDISSVASAGAAAIYPYHIDSGAFSTWEEAEQAKANLAQKLPGVSLFLAYANGQYSVRVGAYATRAEAEQKTSEFASALSGLSPSAVGEEYNGYTLVDMNTGEICFEVTLNEYYPAIYPIQKTGESFQFIKTTGIYYPGALEYKRITNGNISMINVVDLQDYVEGILPNEMSNSWPEEALRAQAICARGYVITNWNRHKAEGFNICNTTHCQVYRGRTNVNDRIIKTVASTKGMVATYKGSPISTVFHSSSGGYTESNSNVWGGSALEYYTPVNDVYTPSKPWSVTFTNSELTARLKKQGYDIGNVTNFYVSEFTKPAGNVYSITVEDDKGKKLVIKQCDKVRVALGVDSPRFKVTGGTSASVFVNSSENKVTSGSELAILTADGLQKFNGDLTSLSIMDGNKDIVSPEGSNTGSYTITGEGWGHNVGMSQYGAREMAKKGFTGEEIIKFYYTGTEVTALPELVK